MPGVSWPGVTIVCPIRHRECKSFKAARLIHFVPYLVVEESNWWTQLYFRLAHSFFRLGHCAVDERTVFVNTRTLYFRLEHSFLD